MKVCRCSGDCGAAPEGPMYNCPHYPRAWNEKRKTREEPWYDNGQPMPRQPADGDWLEKPEPWYDNGQPMPQTPTDGQW